jgi:hypothetical protein
MGKKVTDLERFATEHIYNPYKTTLDSAYERLAKPVPRDLENAVYHLMNVPEWRELVLGRINKIGFYFPRYIRHILVDYIEDKLK